MVVSTLNPYFEIIPQDGAHRPGLKNINTTAYGKTLIFSSKTGVISLSSSKQLVEHNFWPKIKVFLNLKKSVEYSFCSCPKANTTTSITSIHTDIFVNHFLGVLGTSIQIIRMKNSTLFFLNHYTFSILSLIKKIKVLFIELCTVVSSSLFSQIMCCLSRPQN